MSAVLLQHPEMLPTTDQRVIPCLGVYCEKHPNCQCYAAVEFSDPAALRMWYCGKPGLRPFFIPIRST